MQYQTAVRFTARTRANSSTGMSARSHPFDATPALLWAKSRRPYRATVNVTISTAASASATFVGTKSTASASAQAAIVSRAPVLVQVGDDDARARVDAGDHGGTADPGGAPGHDPNPTLER